MPVKTLESTQLVHSPQLEQLPEVVKERSSMLSKSCSLYRYESTPCYQWYTNFPNGSWEPHGNIMIITGNSLKVDETNRKRC